MNFKQKCVTAIALGLFAITLFDCSWRVVRSGDYNVALRFQESDDVRTVSSPIWDNPAHGQRSATLDVTSLALRWVALAVLWFGLFTLTATRQSAPPALPARG